MGFALRMARGRSTTMTIGMKRLNQALGIRRLRTARGAPADQNVFSVVRRSRAFWSHLGREAREMNGHPFVPISHRREAQDQDRRSIRPSLARLFGGKRRSTVPSAHANHPKKLSSMLNYIDFSDVVGSRSDLWSTHDPRLLPCVSRVRVTDRVPQTLKSLIRVRWMRVGIESWQLRHSLCNMISVRAGMTARLRRFFRRNLRGEANRRKRNERRRFEWLGFGTHGVRT